MTLVDLFEKLSMRQNRVRKWNSWCYSRLVKKTDHNTKMTEIENNIPSINGFATNAALNAVEDKISNVSNLVKKSNYDIQITEIEKTLLIMIMINMLLPQNSMIYQQGFLLQR